MDRKAAIRQYKESRRPMGAYRVRNNRNGKSLVGTAVNVPAMLNRQQAQLRMGLHPNRELQQDWNALGPEAFEFEILDTIEPADRADYDPSEDLRALEALWLEKLSPFEDRGYNAKPRRSS